MEGCADMTGCTRGQPNEGGRGDATTVDNLGAEQLSRHPECRFCLDPTSVVAQASVLSLNAPGDRRYIGRLGGWRSCRAKVIWEMSAQHCSVIRLYEIK